MLYQNSVPQLHHNRPRWCIYVYSDELLIQEAEYKYQDHSSIQSPIFTSRTWYQIIVQNFDKTFERTRADVA